MLSPIPPGPLSPATARRLTELLQRLDNPVRMRAAAPLAVTQRDGVMLLSDNTPPRILMRLTGHDPEVEYQSGDDSADEYEIGCKYSWVEVDVTPDSCGHVDISGGRRGWTDKFPAVAINGDESLAVGTIVEAWLAPSGTHWRFSPGGGSGGAGSLLIEVITCAELVDDGS